MYSDKETLEMYLTQDKNREEIAKHFNIGISTMQEMLPKHKEQKRTIHRVI